MPSTLDIPPVDDTATMSPEVRREFVGPANSFPLSSADFEKACALCDTMRELRDRRTAYLSSQDLDPRVFLPAHMWDAAFVDDHFDNVTRKDYHTLNNLRFLTYNFTGYQMHTMEAANCAPPVDEIPADIDARVRQVTGKAAEAAKEFVRAIQGIPEELIVDVPRMFGESGWDVGGSVANWDTWSTQQRINGLHSAGMIDFLRARVAARGYARIVEIGAGYGNLAYSLRKIIGPMDYTVLDLPESLVFSSIYLGTVMPGETSRVAQPDCDHHDSGPGFRFVANYLSDEYLPQLGEVDLVINTMSLSEMSSQQVAYYGDWAGKLIGDQGVFYEQNYILPGVHEDIVAILREQFAYSGELTAAVQMHRHRGVARAWTNGYVGALWDSGAFASIGSSVRPPAPFRSPVPAPIELPARDPRSVRSPEASPI